MGNESTNKMIFSYMYVYVDVVVHFVMGLVTMIHHKLAFHTLLDIIIKNNSQRNNETFAFQTSFCLWDKLLDVFLKANKSRCS